MKLTATAFAAFTVLTGPVSALSQPISVCDENVVPFDQSVERARVLGEGLMDALRFSEGRDADEVIATLRNEIDNGEPSNVAIYETLLATYTLKLAIDEFVRAGEITLDQSILVCGD